MDGIKFKHVATNSKELLKMVKKAKKGENITLDEREIWRKVCNKCHGKGRITDADGTYHTCYGCLQAGRIQ